jgi:glycosyltransferase involved in cell wall biosynthesis
MRILYANKFYYPRGGAERVLLDEMELMKSKGHQTAIFACRHPANLESEYSGYFVDYIDYFNASLWDKANAAFKIIYSREAYSKFIRLIDYFKPDVIHAHNIYAQLSASILDAAKKRGVKVVLTAHDYKLVCPSYLMLNHGAPCEKCLGGRFYHCLTTKCHKDDRIASAIYTAESYFNDWLGKYESLQAVLCPSEFMRNKLRAGVAEEKLKVVRNPVQAHETGPILTNEGYFLYAGRLSKEKGVQTLLEVFRGLDLPLVVAGTGPMEADLKSRAGTNVRFVGHQTGKTLARYYQGALACVVPSEWYENAPLAVLEPLGYGKPVIGADIGGIPELIQENINGWLFKAFNPDDLKAKVRLAADLSKEKTADMGRHAWEGVRRDFSLDHHYEALMTAYT